MRIVLAVAVVIVLVVAGRAAVQAQQGGRAPNCTRDGSPAYCVYLAYTERIDAPTMQPTPTVTPEPTLAPPPPGLRDGGFELTGEGTERIWRARGAEIVSRSDAYPSIVPRTGNRFAEMSAYGDGYGQELSQRITVPARATLSFYYLIRSDRVCGTTNVVTITFNGTEVDRLLVCNVNQRSSWSSYSVDMTRFAGQTGTLEFYGDRGVGFANSIWFDDMALE